MASIHEIVSNVIATGTLSDVTIQQLRNLLKLEYKQEDIDALLQLHQAVVAGKVKHESLPENKPNLNKSRRGIVKMKLVCQTTFAAVIIGTVVLAMPKSPEQAVLNTDINTMDIWQQ